MSVDQKLEIVYQDKKRRRLFMPTKSASPKLSPTSEQAPGPVPVSTPARYDYDQWKNSVRAAEQSLPLTSRPPAHIPVNAGTSNGVNMVMVKTNDIQANKPSVIKSNPNVIG